MRKATIAKFIGHLKGVINSGLTRSAYAISKELSNAYFSNTFSKIIQDFKKGNVGIDDFNTVVELMSQIDSSYVKYRSLADEVHAPVTDILKEVSELAMLSDRDTQKEATLETISDEEPDDERNSIEFERDENGRIKFYKFKVLIRDKEPLTGKLSRDEMNMIYRMYSYYGMSITQREVSRYFPEYSLIDFKRILRVFNITKASSPFAPHVIEEHSSEELVQMQLREKENDFLRVLEKERIRNNETLLKKYAIENIELKNNLQNVSNILSGFEFPINIPSLSPTNVNNSKRTLFIWLSDMHIGASVAGTSIYCNNYDEFEVGERMQKILNVVSSQGAFNDIIVCNLGDSLDGMDKQTTRRDHFLPQNMDNKEQVHSYLRIMETFFLKLKDLSNNLYYYCVGSANHDGDYGWLANVALAALLEKQGVTIAKVFDSFIGHFKYMDTTYVLCHGKDEKDMKKNYPLVIDAKTELKINEYLDYHKIYGNVVFVKGDLHQSAITYAKRFQYKSVGSLFGSSEWIHKNFGNTPAACDYTILDGDAALDGHIVLQ